MSSPHPLDPATAAQYLARGCRTTWRSPSRRGQRAGPVGFLHRVRHHRRRVRRTAVPVQLRCHQRAGWFLFNGLVTHDTLTGRDERYQFEPGVFCSEVGVVPRVGGAEEDAYLVTLTVEENRDLSECVVFRANDVSRGPIARAQLPERIASGTHSCWAPGDSIKGW